MIKIFIGIIFLSSASLAHACLIDLRREIKSGKFIAFRLWDRGYLIANSPAKKLAADFGVLVTAGESSPDAQDNFGESITFKDKFNIEIYREGTILSSYSGVRKPDLVNTIDQELQLLGCVLYAGIDRNKKY